MKILLVLAWNNIAGTTIQNCFHKAGFSKELSDEGTEGDPFSAWKQSLDELQICNDQLIPKNITQDDFPCVHDRLTATETIMSDEIIIQEIREPETANENEEEDCSEEVHEPEIPNTSLKSKRSN